MYCGVGGVVNTTTNTTCVTDTRYTADDTDDIAIDLLGTIVVVLVGFGSLIGLVLLYRWFKGKKTF